MQKLGLVERGPGAHSVLFRQQAGPLGASYCSS